MSKHPLRIDANEHAATALRLIHRFSWLRPTELGRLLYPRNKHARKYAEKLLRKLTTLRLVIERKLPGRSAGTAYVVATRGATQLDTWADVHKGYKSGKDWGAYQNGVWYPPNSWQHDLWAIGVASLLAEQLGHEVLPDSYLRHTAPFEVKYPDALLVCRDKGFSAWLEVESSRKTGRNLEQLVRAVIGASRGSPLAYFDEVQDTPVKVGIIAILVGARDERGYNLDHWGRFERKLQALGGVKAPVALIRCWMTLKGVGIGAIRIDHITLSPYKQPITNP